LRIDAFVTRKTQDLVCDAAEDLLRESKGHVRAVKRAEVWSFEIESEAARSELREILEETTLIVNPNVHRYTLDPEKAAGAPGTSRVLVRVRDRVDPKATGVLRALRNVHGARSIGGISRAVLWTIDLDIDDAARAERFAREIAGLDRGAGILANTHAQEVEVRVATNPSLTPDAGPGSSALLGSRPTS
jgi:phosphoribosylformylglycinamidine (FGAM) synthase PurS component